MSYYSAADAEEWGAEKERKRIVARLRSDTKNVDPIGGDNWVARTIAEAIERGEHLKVRP